MRTLLSILSILAALSIAAPVYAQKLDPEVKTLVDGNTEFGLALYQCLAHKDGNLFFSPYSISNALGMTYAGAKGNTAAEMKATLRFHLPRRTAPPRLRQAHHRAGRRRQEAPLPAHHRQSPLG